MAFWLIAVLVAGLAFVAFTVHVEETSVGAWHAGPTPGAVTVALPEGALDRLHTGVDVSLRRSGAPALAATVTTIVGVMSAEEVRSQFGHLPRAFHGATVVAVVEVAVRAPHPLASGANGGATAHLGSRTLAAELVPALRNETG
jgi:hypothetical protein